MDTFKEYLQNRVEVPQILIQLLYLAGYDNPIAVKGINPKNIFEMEKYISNNSEHVLANSVYAGMEKFVFLPGHKALLCGLPPYAEKYEQETNEVMQNRFVEALPVSFIMKQMIKTALKNQNKDERHRQFSTEIQHFATFIYTMCGKACYEVLCNNLPLPQANTICKSNKRST